MKSFDPNEIKIYEKSYQNIFIYYTGYVTIKDSKYVKINSVNPLYLQQNGYFEKMYENKHLALVLTNEINEMIKKYYELWSKIRYLIRSITKNSDDYDKKYMKIKFNSDEELPPNKTTEIHSMIIVVRVYVL